MELIIDNEDTDIDLTEFCNFLIDKMKLYMSGNIIESKITSFDIYLNDPESKAISWINEDEKYIISTKKLLISSIYCLEVTKYENTYKIALNNDQYIPNTSAKFIDIIKLINYGNTLLFAYPIYDDMMKWVSDNLNSFYKTYLEETE